MSKENIQEGLYKKSTFDNGLRIVTEHIPYVRSVAIGFCITGGSRREPGPLNGAAHFIEHMLFKGTKTRSVRDIAFEIDSLGGHLDAFTSREYTCFLANCSDENLKAVTELLIDILLNPTFPPDEMERERGVILEEIHSNEDTPDDYVHDILIQNFWGAHSLGRPILGLCSTISDLTRDRLVEYYHKTYQSHRIILAAAGNLNHEQILDMVIDSIPSTDHPYKFPHQPSPSINQNLSCKEKDLEQVHICIGTAGLPHTDNDRYIGYLLNTILGGGISSRLFQTIREEKGLVYSVYSFWSSYTDTGILGVYAGTKKESAEEVISLILKEFRKIKTDYVEKEELERAKNQVKGQIILGLESTVNRMSKLAKQEMYFGRNFTLNETMESINQVTREDILNLANLIISPSYLNLASIGPLNEISLGKNKLVC